MKYKILLIDPPWLYPVRKPGSKFGGGAASQYPLMKIKDIVETFCMMDTIAEKNAAIFCWATNPKLKEFFKCVEALEKKKYGWRYATCAFTWTKINKDGTPFKGIGNYTGSNAEPCYMIVRGSMAPEEKLVDSTIWHPRLKHSQKPDEAHSRIERMYPINDNSHIELFARRERLGWTTIGGELTNRDIREDIQLLCQA